MEEKNKKEEVTEEELRRKLKEELRAELLEELKSEEKESSADVEKKPIKNPVNSSSEKVHFENYNSNELETINAMHRKEREMNKKESHSSTLETKEKGENLKEVAENSNSKGSPIVIIVALIIAVATVFLFPKAYHFFSKVTTKPEKIESSNSSSNEEPVYEKITTGSKVLTTFTYPIMRNSQYEKASYYQRESITMSEFSNNDILYNAFIHVYSGSIGPYKGGYAGTYCGTQDTKKEVNSKYLEARIDNLFSKNTKYTHATFKVPSTNKDTPYVGTWVYNAKTKKYVYYGDCEGVTPSNIMYYDLKQISKANGNANNTVIEVTYYMGFAEVNTSNKNYTIYSDANMTSALATGTLTSTDYEQELNAIFNNYLSNAQSYKYTFSSNNCSFQDYCFEKGEWLK